MTFLIVLLLFLFVNHVQARGEIKITSIVDGQAIGCGHTHTLQWMYVTPSAFRAGDVLIAMLQIDGFTSNTDLSEMGRVVYPATSLVFKLPQPVPVEWVTKGVSPNQSNDITVSVYLARDGTVNSDQQTAGIFGDEPEWRYTCANGQRCNVGNADCSCNAAQTCNGGLLCSQAICSRPPTPMPTQASNAACTQSTPGALGVCAADPTALLSCQCLVGTSVQPCNGTATGSCLTCNAGELYCRCDGTSCVASAQCLNGRCFPNLGCLNCPCQGTFCDNGLTCAAGTCVSAAPPVPTCSPGTANCVCKTGAVCNDATLACISGLCRTCDDGLETCACQADGRCQGALVCNADTKRCQRATCQPGTLNCPCSAAKTCVLSVHVCDGSICVPEGQSFTSRASTTPAPVVPGCTRGFENCGCATGGTCLASGLVCNQGTQMCEKQTGVTPAPPGCTRGDENCQCAELNGTPACTSNKLICNTKTNTCQKACEKGDENCPCADLNGVPACKSPKLICSKATGNCQLPTSVISGGGAGVRFLSASATLIAAMVALTRV